MKAMRSIPATKMILRYAFMALLMAGCLAAGYGFYRFNDRDLVNAICFTFGITGIMLSVLRTPRP